MLQPRVLVKPYGIQNSLVQEVMEEVEVKVFNGMFYAIDAVDKEGTSGFPTRFVDGAAWDHTGLTMTIKGLQREGRSGDILCLTMFSLESYENFHCMFADFDNKGDHRGIAATPYPRCFKGMPPTACAQFGKYLQVLDCMVETVDCPAFQIRGGCRYRLFHIFVEPGSVKVFPFKQESVEEYVSWSSQVLKDLQEWSLHDHRRADMPTAKKMVSLQTAGDSRVSRPGQKNHSDVVRHHAVV